MTESSKRPVKESSKVLKVSGNAVGQTSLEVCPNKFIGVQRRRVSREVNGVDARVTSEALMEFGGQDTAMVPENQRDGIRH